MSNSQIFDSNMAKRHPINILIVDDNAINLKVASRMLLRMGYYVDQATNGWEALEAQQRNGYDLIFMDIQMPEMDGVTATKHILDRYATEERPRIVAVTAHAMIGDRERYLEAGMDGYISKPIRVDRLIDEIEGTPSKKSDFIRKITVDNSTQRLNTANLPQPFDSQIFANMLGMPQEDASEILPELIELFIEDSISLIDKIDMAIPNEDFNLLCEAAHKMKGGAASIAAMRLSEACDALEKMGLKQELAGVGIKFGQAKLEFYRLETWLADHRLKSNRKTV